ncbi:Transcription factor bHLH135 [Platanthera guangdongensis]|uniref:Transcription factor bHLH135 n=1 Tax=Platanthera guangdongensis TaxID=2320717 RepID=A0ABR2MUM6_9ASPA
MCFMRARTFGGGGDILYIKLTGTLEEKKKEEGIKVTSMPSRRSRSSRQSAASSTRITEEQINDLVSKLQALLPEARLRDNDRTASSGRVLQETCNYIRSLHQEVDDLTEKLSELLESTVGSSAQAAIIRSLLLR